MKEPPQRDLIQERLARMRQENKRAGRPSYDTISPADFVAWCDRHGFTLNDLCHIFDISRRCATNYRTVKVPRIVALACRAIDLESRRPGARILVDIYRGRPRSRAERPDGPPPPPPPPPADES